LLARKLVRSSVELGVVQPLLPYAANFRDSGCWKACFRASSEPHPPPRIAQPTGDLLPSFLDATPEPEVCARLCSHLRDSAFRDGSANSTSFGIHCRARLRVSPPV